jgi:hypothetical protein
MLASPNWFLLPPEDRRGLRYFWDETRASKCFSGNADWILEASIEMSLRARLALCAAMYESIVWRFEGLHSREEPLQIAEAAWCATVDPRYLKYFELTRAEWTGPVEGPLWCAVAWLQPALSQGHQFEKAVFDAIDYLGCLALHVMPRPELWREWLTAALARLSALHPPLEDDPFDDLFDRHVGSRLGPLVGRDAFDPQGNGDIQATAEFLSRLLIETHRSDNPFLADPDDLEDAGFVGTPYQLPDQG